jgi:hypothetical protein
MVIENEQLKPNALQVKSDTLVTQRDALLISIKTMEITNEDDYRVLCDAQTRLRAFQKVLEKEQKAETQPHFDWMKTRREWYAATFAKIHDTERVISGRISKWATDREAKRRAEQAKLDAQATQRLEKTVAKGQVPSVPEPVAPIVPAAPKTIQVDGGKHTEKMVRKWRYANGTASNPELSKIPLKFHLIDEKKINRFVTAGVFTVSSKLSPMEYTIDECPDIVVYEEAESATRSSMQV